MPRAMPVDYAVNRGDQIELVRSQPRSTGDSFVASDYGMPRALPSDYALASGDQIEVVRALPSGSPSDKIEFVRTQPRSIGEPQVVAAGFDWKRRGPSAQASHSGSCCWDGAPLWRRATPVAPRPPRTRRGRQASRKRASVPAYDCFGLDLDEPARIEQPAGEKRCVRRADISEDLSVGAADALEIVGPHQVDAGADDVRERGARLLEGGADDLEAAPGLAVGVLGRIGAVGHDGCGAGHVHVLADTDCAGEADDGLVR